MKTRRYKRHINGMQCVDCENNIAEALSNLPGVIEVDASFTDETIKLVLDADTVTLKTVAATLKKTGYELTGQQLRKPGGFIRRFFLIVLALAGIAALFQLDEIFELDISLDDIGATANYGLLFMVGIMTSFHCIGMCGGFVISYTVGSKTSISSYWNHLFYGIGKLLSYSGFGALFGLIGGAITITFEMRSVASASAGIFLIIYGLSMLEAFSGLRRFHIRIPFKLNRFLQSPRQRTQNPFIIGLLNGLMIACGPLQAMYIMAAGTGDPLEGAKLLSVFALGTLPVMFLFGTFASMITSNTSQRLIKASGFIIILLGAVMLNRSIMLTGTGYDANSLISRISQEAKNYFMTWQHDHADAGSHIQEGYQIIYMEAEKKAYIPNQYTLRYGIPVKWVINVKQLSSCNKKIIVPALDLIFELKPGLQIVEFTPKQVGVISWSCHMGMIPGTFVVKK